jgi:hypothetical protein
MIAIGGSAAGLVLLRDDDRTPAHRAGTATDRVQIVAVAKTDLANSRTIDGSLGYGVEQPVKAGSGGRVTWLPAPGTTVSRDGVLFRVDDRPVTLLYGNTPLFRRLDAPGLVGRDIKVVADNLTASGFDIGRQPSVGSTVRQPAPAGAPPTDAAGAPPTGRAATPQGAATTAGAEPAPQATSIKVRDGDGVLTPSVITAIKRWQQKVGLPQTGVLDPGNVVVMPAEIRITAVLARLGDDAATPLVSVASTTKVVTEAAEANAVGSVKVADKVTVSMPDNATTQGTVAAIGRPAEGAAAEAGNKGPGNPPKVTATINLDDPAAVQKYDAAPVRVEFNDEVRQGVLAVPVGALLALREGGYAVQTEGGDLLPVTTGLFAKGMVEISGPGIAEGTKVETTS